MKRKSQDSLEKSNSAWGKAPRLGTSSSSTSTHVRVQGQVLPSPAKVPRAPSSQPRSASATKAKDSSRRAAEPPLEVMPISVWSPSAQSAKPPPSIAEDLGRKCPEADGMRIPCPLMLNLLLARSHPSLGILISRGQVPYLLRRLWIYPSRGSPP